MLWILSIMVNMVLLRKLFSEVFIFFFFWKQQVMWFGFEILEYFILILAFIELFFINLVNDVVELLDVGYHLYFWKVLYLSPYMPMFYCFGNGLMHCLCRQCMLLLRNCVYDTDLGIQDWLWKFCLFLFLTNTICDTLILASKKRQCYGIFGRQNLILVIMQEILLLICCFEFLGNMVWFNIFYFSLNPWFRCFGYCISQAPIIY